MSKVCTSRFCCISSFPFLISLGIVVTGQIDVHGVEYFPTWTRLAATVTAGDTAVVIQGGEEWGLFLFVLHLFNFCWVFFFGSSHA
jgi:hypothetical protein